MSFPTRNLAFVACLSVIACTEPAAVTRQVPVTDDFSQFTYAWRGLTGEMVIRWAVLPGPDGMVEVCGAQAKTRGQGSEHFSEMLRNSVITANGRPIIDNLSYFASVPDAQNLVGSNANCARTAMPVPSGPVEWALQPTGRGAFKV